jgi:hypothetical protein
LAVDAIVTLYMPLANRAAEWRPVKAMRQKEDVYCVIGPVGEGEEWQFPPGSMVRRKPKIMPNGKQEMVAAPL